MTERNVIIPNDPKIGQYGSTLSQENGKIPSYNGNSVTDVKEDSLVKAKEKYTKIQWITFVTLAFGNFCVGACLSLQAPFFPQEAEKKGATPTEYGFIFGIFQLTIFVAAPLMGKLVSYVEAKLMLNIGIFTTGVTCLLFGFLDYIQGRTAFVVVAFIIRAAEGVGSAALRTAGYAIIASQFTENMTTIFASIETFLGIGLIIGPTLGGALFDLGGFGLPFYVVGALVLIDAVIIFVALPNTEPSTSSKKGQLLKFWMHPTTLVYASAIFSTFTYLGFNQATLEPHVREFELRGVYLGLIFGIPGVCYAVSAPIWGWLCDHKCNVQFVAVLGYILAITSLILIGPMPFTNIESSLQITIAALFLLGIGVGAKIVPSFNGSLRDTIARGFPEDISTYALISSMIASSQSLGAFVGPSVGGYLLESKGYITGTIVIMSIEAISFFFLIMYVTICKQFLFKKKESDEKKQILGNHRDPNRVRTETDIRKFSFSIHSTL